MEGAFELTNQQLTTGLVLKQLLRLANRERINFKTESIEICASYVGLSDVWKLRVEDVDGVSLLLKQMIGGVEVSDANVVPKLPDSEGSVL